MQTLRLLSLLLVFASIGGFVTGCGSDGPNSSPTTPTGVTNIAIQAKSATAIQQTTVALTVK